MVLTRPVKSSDRRRRINAGELVTLQVDPEAIVRVISRDGVTVVALWGELQASRIATRL